MNVLSEIKDLYNRDGKIGEDQYKQRFFLDFFKELGYEKKEIEFEKLIRGPIYDTDKFVDVVCGDILLEVKSSNKALNKDVLKQVFQYNQGVGKNIVGITNFKKFEFYDKSANKLILEFGIHNFKDKRIDIYTILGKNIFKKEKDYVRYDCLMYKFYKIEKMLNKYLAKYSENNFKSLPVMFSDDIALLPILRKLQKFKETNLNLNPKLDDNINNLFNNLDCLSGYQSNIYFNYPVNGERIFKFKELWLEPSHPEKLEAIEKILSYIRDINFSLKEINIIDNKIRDSNDPIWNLKDYYEKRKFYC